MPRAFGRRRWLAASLGTLVPAPGGARAATIEVAPILTDLAPGQMATVLTVTNRGAEAASAQVRAFDWSQRGGSDVLSPSDDLIVSPPIFALPPNGAQAIRLLLRRPATGGERAFRLLVDEIPGAANGVRQVRFALRLSLPVFAQGVDVGGAGAGGAGACSGPGAGAGPGAAAPLLDWRLAGGRLSVRNRGRRRAQLFNMVLAGPGGARLALQEPEIPYVLAGSEQVWTLRGAAPRPGTVLHAKASGEAGPVDAELVAAPG